MEPTCQGEQTSRVASLLPMWRDPGRVWHVAGHHWNGRERADSRTSNEVIAGMANTVTSGRLDDV